MSKATIICVDDEELILSSIKEQLKQATFTNDVVIETVNSPMLALEIVNEALEAGIDLPLVISDWLMPDMKGDEFLSIIHKLSPSTLTILLTGHASAEAVGQAVNNANLYRFISKPWLTDDFILTVREAIRSYFTEKSLEEKNIILHHMAKKLTDVNTKLEKKVNLFSRFVPAQFLRLLEIDKEKDHIELGQCAERILTVMFSDIRLYTLISESQSARQTFLDINEYFSAMAPFIKQYNGFIDKYIGDAIMSLFPSTDDAVNAAINMLHHSNLSDPAEKLKKYSTGIGINTGSVIIGTIGEPDRIETTTIGDVVNVASRIEHLTRVYKTALLISGNTYKSLSNPSQFNLRYIDRVLVHGRSEYVDLYEVLDGLDEASRTKRMLILDIFKQAREAYLHHNYILALKLFTECVDLCPQDEVSRIYINRIEGKA